jgi:hypothetical protein
LLVAKTAENAMADGETKRQSCRRDILTLEEGWEVELWRRAYGVTRFRLAQADNLSAPSLDEAPETSGGG